MGLTNKVAQITNESIFSNMDLHTYRKVHAMVVLYLHGRMVYINIGNIQSCKLINHDLIAIGIVRLS